jgi:serine/threonine protein kinase
MNNHLKLDSRSDNNLQNLNKNQDSLLYKLFFSKYRTIKKLGEGSFGKVYKAEYNGEYYAMKFENRIRGQSLLESEATIMKYLKGPNIPQIIKYYDSYNDYNILIMQLLDKSLEDLINIKKKFSIKTTCMLGFQMMNVLQYIHDRHIIHRDIKPDNFVMGAGENNAHLYLLDFGLAKKYRSSRTLIQYPMIKKKKLTGTARYASIHALEEWEQSRRDDLESVGYVLMYFLKGKLPWQGLNVKVKEMRYQKILEKKKETTSEALCKGFPNEFREYVEYTRNLGYEEEPNYDKLRSLFLNLVCDQMGENFDFIYDWTTSSDLKKRKEENYNDIVSSTYYLSEKKSNNRKDIDSLYSIKKKKGDTLNVNNYTVYKTIQSNENISKNNNIIFDNKHLDEKVESKCCIM